MQTQVAVSGNYQITHFQALKVSLVPIERNMQKMIIILKK